MSESDGLASGVTGELGTAKMGGLDPGDDAARLRVVIADDDPLARRVVRDALQDDGIIVAAEADNGRDAVELAVYYKPEIVLMDASIPGIGGIEALSRILSRCPDTRVVIFSVSADSEVGLHSLRAGASGFLTKDIDIRSLPQALRRIVDGEIACSRAFVQTLVSHLRSTPEGGIGMRPVKSPLSPREWEVLDLLCDGASTQAIADALVLSTETVRSHVKNLMRKLEVRTRQDAIALAPSLRLPDGSADGDTDGDSLSSLATA
jgi:DNA-binding NarL/FixJ family response regulator